MRLAMWMMLPAIVVAFDAAGMGSRAASHASRAAVTMKVAKTKKDMILSKTRFASGGARVAGDEEEVSTHSLGRRWADGAPKRISDHNHWTQCVAPTQMEILWREFRKCYPNEELATAAAERNSNVFNPQLNSPTKIKVRDLRPGDPACRTAPGCAHIRHAHPRRAPTHCLSNALARREP